MAQVPVLEPMRRTVSQESYFGAELFDFKGARNHSRLRLLSPKKTDNGFAVVGAAGATNFMKLKVQQLLKATL